MVSLEPELEALRPTLGDARTDALIARERREVFSIVPELRICAWLGATLLATAAGIVLKNNFERIGPLALSILIAVAAAACYGWTWMRRARASVADDYVLLLGALLVSTDVAFIEAQFHLLDEHWKHHLIVLAVLHGIGAYAYGSRMLLSLAVVALAGWIGFDRGFTSPEALALPAFATAAALIGWREVDRRLHGPAFSRTLEHFAANAALLGGLAGIDHDQTLSAVITIGIASIVIWWGFRTRHEPFVLYAVVYAVIALDVMLADWLREPKLILLAVVLSMVAAIIAIMVLHARFASGAREKP